MNSEVKRTCGCKTENIGNFCTECGAQKPYLCTVRFIHGENDFTLSGKAPNDGFYIKGKCAGKKAVTEVSEPFYLHGDITDELFETGITDFPDKNAKEPISADGETELRLEYSDGSFRLKHVSEDAAEKIEQLLGKAIVSEVKAREKRKKETGAADYALFDAIRRNDIAAVKKKIADNPALVNTPAPKKPSDTAGMSPLQVSLCTGLHREIAYFLIESGADVNFMGDKKASSESHPVLFDAVNSALWNSRRYVWDGKSTEPIKLVWKHTEEESDEASAFLVRVLDAGADVNKTDLNGTNALFEALATADFLCPDREVNGSFDPPGKTSTPEMTADFRRIISLLISRGADKNNRSSFLKKSIREYFSERFVWKLCGDIFES